MSAPHQSATAASTSTSTPASTSAPPPDSAFRLYRPPNSVDHSSPDLPDSYFTPTTADLKAAQASLSARSNALQNAPLRTQAMRDADDKARRARWPTTTIRVKFSDRSQLERTFPSTDKIKSVYAFVRGSLREDVKPIKFVLYQTPPKRELKVSDPKVRDLSLAELQLAPSSVLLLKFEKDELNHSDVPAPLDPSILAQAEDLPLPPNFEADAAAAVAAAATSQGKPAAASTQGTDVGAGSATKTETKVPKWLKLSKK